MRIGGFDLDGKLVKKIILVFVSLFVSTLIASFIFGVLTTMSNNIQSFGLNQFSFDPMITIAYMILYYFITLFFQPAAKTQFYLFLYTLFLSFTVNFMQGALYLVVLYFILRKLKVI